jgi:hypothetical protein
VVIDANRHHRVETQELQVGEVVAREGLVVQVGVNAPKSPEASRTSAHALEVGKLDPERIPDGHVLDVTRPVDQRADLSADLEGDLRELPGELL